jgi:hypothetical protein
MHWYVFSLSLFVGSSYAAVVVVVVVDDDVGVYGDDTHPMNTVVPFFALGPRF